MKNIGIWESGGPGVTRRIVDAKGGLMMMEVRFEENATVSEHSHVHEQMTYCLSGKLEYRVEDRTRVISAGESVYIPSNAKHAVKALEPSAVLDVFTPIRHDLLKE